MRTNLIPTPSGYLVNRYYKGTHNKSQAVRFYDYLKHNTTTCTQASIDLRIPQKSLCRLKRMFEKRGELWEVRQVKCPITNQYAYTLTTNPEQAPMSNQLKLFTYGSN